MWKAQPIRVVRNLRGSVASQAGPAAGRETARRLAPAEVDDSSVGIRDAAIQNIPYNRNHLILVSRSIELTVLNLSIS